jgi:hypothetical protein
MAAMASSTVLSGKFTLAGRKGPRRIGLCPRRIHRDVVSGFSRTWDPEAFGRLRALVVGVDEIALEMRRQHARARRRPLRPRARHLIEERSQLARRARDRRRTEGGDPVSRQALGHPRDRVLVVEGVHALDAVDVHVDEAGHDERVGDVDHCGARGIGATPRLDGRDPPAVDDERSVADDAVGQDEIAARQDDHGASMAARAAP